MIYLDSAASTPLHPCVDQSHHFGNAGSRTHRTGLALRSEVEKARQACSELMEVRPEQLVFTSGATESLMIVVQGLKRSGHLDWAVASTEHKAALNQVLDVNPSARILSANKNGIIEPIETSPGSVAVCMHVNNETGVINEPWRDLKKLGAAITICDATQSIGKLDLKIKEHAIDFLVGSAHKFNGPIGCGFLVAKDIDSWDLVRSPSLGGGQERGLRGGTLNATSIIQTGEVAHWLKANATSYRMKILELRDEFEHVITQRIGGLILCQSEARAPHITSLHIPGVDNEALISAVNAEIAISSGSACTSEKMAPSHVLMAMFNDIEMAESTVRISFGWHNTQKDIQQAVEIIARATDQIRSFY